MNYCSHCGHPVNLTIPNNDNRIRHVCSNCKEIHYQNPKIIAGCIPLWQNYILLCRRSIEPRYGLWTLPAGFMENDESVLQAALRECEEEACAKIIDPQLHGIYSIPKANQVYVLFRGHLCAQDSFDIGVESLEVRLFSEDEIPWDKIAFKVMVRSLQHFITQRKSGQYSITHEEINHLQRTKTNQIRG